LASIRLSDNEAERLARDCFSSVLAKELKHSALVRRPIGQEMVVEFVKHLKPEDCATYVVHKAFCLLTKLVDLWLEPAMYASDVDLYDGGGNIAFANMSFFCLRTFQSSGFLTKHLRRFQKMVRERTRKSYQTFWKGLHEDRARYTEQTASILGFFTSAEWVLGPSHLFELPEKSLDISLTCALQIAEEWTDRTTEDFQIVHDESSAKAREKWMWDAIVSPSAPAATVGFPHRKRRYPLHVTGTRFENSKGNRQLQFADLLAGATAEWARGKMRKSDRRDYCSRLENAGLRNFLVGGMWPVPKVERLEGATRRATGGSACFLWQTYPRCGDGGG